VSKKIRPLQNNQKGVRVLYNKGVASQANSAVLKAQKLRRDYAQKTQRQDG
jgi:hypothetical protein